MYNNNYWHFTDRADCAIPIPRMPWLWQSSSFSSPCTSVTSSTYILCSHFKICTYFILT